MEASPLDIESQNSDLVARAEIVLIICVGDMAKAIKERKKEGSKFKESEVSIGIFR